MRTFLRWCAACDARSSSGGGARRTPGRSWSARSTAATPGGSSRATRSPAASSASTWFPLPRATSAACTSLWVRSGPSAGADLVCGPATALTRVEPYQARCPDGLLVARQYGATRLLSRRRPADLDESPAWLVVTTSVDVSTTDLGCDPWALVFCQSPVDEPVLG